MIPAYTPKELDHFELSPRDNLADYDSPLDYLAVVKTSVEAGKLGDYTLTELEKVEKRFSQAYSLLSNEQIKDYEDVFSKAFTDIITLQNTAEAEEYIGTVRGNLAAGKCDNYNFSEISGLKSKLDQAFDALPRQEKSADDLQIYLDLDAVYNKGISGRALNYLNAASKLLAEGNFDQYTVSELQKVEKQFEKAYSALAEEKKEEEKERYAQTIKALTNLKGEQAKGDVAALVQTYLDEAKNDPQAWEGVKIGNHQRSAAVEEKPLSEDEKDTVEYSLANLPVVPPEEVRLGKKFTSKKDKEESYSLDKMTQYALKTEPITASQSWEDASILGNGAAPEGSISYKAACVTALPKKAILQMLEDKVIINYTVTPLKKAETEKEAVAMALKAAVVPLLTKKKSNLLGYIATAAIVAVAGIGSVVGYNYLAPSVKNAADTQLKQYHGAPSAEASASAANTKQSQKPSKAKSVENESKTVEQPAIAPQAAPSTAPRKVIKRYPASWDPYEDNLHTIEKGETLGGLYEDYAARGGTLSRSAYIRQILAANPHLEEGASRIYIGQEVLLPN